MIKKLLSVLVLSVFLVGSLVACNISPPKIPTPTPPEISQEEPAPQPKSLLQGLINAPEVVNPGTRVVIDASQIEEELGNDITFSWEQLRTPDKYTGAEYISGNQVTLDNAEQAVTAFTPEWPGNYRFKLTVSTNDGKQHEVTVEVLVKPSQPIFEVCGIALDYWHYTDSLAYMAPDFFDRTVADGAKLTMICPTWYMPSHTATTMSPCPLEPFDPNIYRGVISDEKLVEMIREAHDRGLEVVINVHLQVAGPTEPEWAGQIQPTSWDEWFENYTAVVVHYAEIAERENVERLAIGNEVSNSLVHTAHWRRLIEEVRQVYSGKLSYHGFITSGEPRWAYPSSQAEFWDDLDYIGVNFWSPATGAYGIAESTYPTVDEMAQVLDKQLAETLDPLAAKYNLPVIITEFGTTSYDGTNISHYRDTGILDNGEQAEFYEAGFRVFASRPYIKGVIIWAFTWEPHLTPQCRTMSPALKPAENVIKVWFKTTD